MPEQRKSRRFDLRLPLELLRNGQQLLVERCETRNVSSSGVLFCSTANFEPGDVVEYVISFPSTSQGIEVRLACKGRVVRRAADSEAAATLERWEFVRVHGRRPV